MAATSLTEEYRVADISLADFGRKESNWPNTRCPD